MLRPSEPLRCFRQPGSLRDKDAPGGAGGFSMSSRLENLIRSHVQMLEKGSRFARLSSKLGKRKGVDDPDALAAYIGREKYGAKKFAKMSESLEEVVRK